MLEIVKFGEDEYDFPCLLALGCFDGLHIGHMDLLKKAKLQAKINGLDLGVMMFADGKGGKLLYSFEERVKILEQNNVKFVLKIDFNDEFKKIKALEFLERLDEKLNVKAFMSGKDFRFGNDKKGKSSTLKSYADDEENGVWYMSVKDVEVGGEKVSTTMIKSLLQSGEVKLAGELLGRNYSVTGKIVHGADRGGKVLGCPTINVEYPECKYEVKQGVYEVICVIEDKTYTGVANYGARPTFDESQVLLEVNLNDCNEDLYGKTATVEFVDYIRDIQKFDDAKELSEQIQKDKAQTELAATDAEPETVSAAAENTDVKEETAEEIERANQEFEAELDEKIPVSCEEIAEVDKKTTDSEEQRKEEKTVESDTTEETAEVNSEIISEPSQDEESND